MGSGKALAELNSLDGRDGKDRLRNAVFKAVKHRPPKPHRQVQNRALDDAAHGIAQGPHFLRFFQHLVPLGGRKDREAFL